MTTSIVNSTDNERCLVKNMNAQSTSKKPRILILGSTGRTGKAVIAELERKSDSVVYSSRNRAQVDAWRQEGKDAVCLDLNDARTFPAALTGIDRLFLATGYTVEMVHQSKTIVASATAARPIHTSPGMKWSSGISRAAVWRGATSIRTSSWTIC